MFINHAGGQRINQANATVDVRDFRPNIITGEFVSKKGSYFPYRYLPTLFKYDKMYQMTPFAQVAATPTKVAYVMPIGTVVSSYSVLNVAGGLPSNPASPPYSWEGGANPMEDAVPVADDILNLLGADDNGQITVGLDVYGNAITVDFRDPYYGYPEDLSGIFTICNGETNGIYDRYTNYDNEMQFPDYNGQPISAGTAFDINTNLTGGAPGAGLGPKYAVSGNAIQRVGMRPVGIIINDVRRDDRGHYWMYDNLAGQDGYAILVEGKIKIPYVVDNFELQNIVNVHDGGDVVLFTPGGGPYDLGISEVSAGGRGVATTAYNSVVQYPFLVIDADGELPNAAEQGIRDVYCDVMGKFTATNGGTITPTAKVGTLLELDNRFPRDMMEYVDTPMNSGTQGTDTVGIYKVMYAFAYNVLNAAQASIGAGGTVTRKTVLEAISAGIFGYAEIMVNCI